MQLSYDATSGVALQHRYARKYKSDIGHENKGNIDFLILHNAFSDFH